MRGERIEKIEREATLSARGLRIGYKINRRDEYSVHEGLNLDLYKGEVTCLLGLNGAGKSTLLRTLCGFQPKLGGEITLLGKPINSYSQHQLSLNMGVVLTEKTNAGGISVYELVALGRHPYTGFFGELSAEDHEIIEEALMSVGMSHKSKCYVSELSDGERQKIMIAKALAQQCPIIILDEPTAFLDVTSRIETMVLLHKLASEQGKTILLSTHDLDMAIQMADSLWLQKKGAPLYCGAPEDLILGGYLSTFFNRDGITFDNTTGKLNTPISNHKVGVHGDFTTSYWVGNALLRIGYAPAEPSSERINIKCHAPNNLEITYPNGQTRRVSLVAELRNAIESYYSNGAK